MEYTVRLYYNTGFDINNSPDSLTVLTSQPLLSREFPSVYIRQDLDLTTIKIESNWSNVENCDYCILGSRGYFVTGIKMVSDNVAELALELDSIGTIGIGNVTIIDGHCTRRIIPASEQSIENYDGDVLGEEWKPQHSEQLDTVRGVGHTTGGSLNVIQATADLYNTEMNADVYESEAGDISIGVPQIKNPSTNTTIGMYIGANAVGSYRLPSSALYDADTLPSDVIARVRSLGIESTFLSAYTIPKDYVKTISKASDGTIQQLTNNSKEVQTTATPYEYYSGIENKKVFALYNRFLLVSETSGDSQEFNFNQIYKKGETSPSWTIWADLSPGGVPYARPKYLYGDTASYFTGVVKGSEWQNFELKYNIGSGYALAAQGAGISTVNDLITLGMGLISSGGASVANVYSTGVGITNRWLEFRNNYKVVSPEIQFPQAPNLQSFVGNSFIVLRYRLGEADARRLDNYLHRYGESVDEPLRDYMFTKNTHYEFLQADNVQIRSNKGMRLNANFCDRLARGVRIWHTIPTPEALNVGGN